MTFFASWSGEKTGVCDKFLVHVYILHYVRQQRYKRLNLMRDLDNFHL